jgi:hypothetical protein
MSKPTTSHQPTMDALDAQHALGHYELKQAGFDVQIHSQNRPHHPVATVHKGGRLSEERDAHARLFAAAPDLLNGCNSLLGLIHLISSRSDFPPDIKLLLANNHRIIDAQAAIAKATGEK